MTKTTRKVISAIPGKSRNPSTGLTGHISINRVHGEMTKTTRTVISAMADKNEFHPEGSQRLFPFIHLWRNDK